MDEANELRDDDNEVNNYSSLPNEDGPNPEDDDQLVKERDSSNNDV